MRTSIWSIVVVIAIVAPVSLTTSCHKGASAASKRAHATRTSTGPTDGEAAGRRGSTADRPSYFPKRPREVLGPVTLEIHNVEVVSSTVFDPQVEGGAEHRTLLAILLTVTSKQEQPRILLQPQRFSLETEGGDEMPMHMGAGKQPILTTTYLAPGHPVMGWLTFELRPGVSTYTLAADLRRPKIRVPIEVPSS